MHHVIGVSLDDTLRSSALCVSRMMPSVHPFLPHARSLLPCKIQLNCHDLFTKWRTFCNGIETPYVDPSSMPSRKPSLTPSTNLTYAPSGIQSKDPSSNPSDTPSDNPSTALSSNPSEIPSLQPSIEPSSEPFSLPSHQPSDLPSRDLSSEHSSAKQQSITPTIK